MSKTRCLALALITVLSLSMALLSASIPIVVYLYKDGSVVFDGVYVFEQAPGVQYTPVRLGVFVKAAERSSFVNASFDSRQVTTSSATYIKLEASVHAELINVVNRVKSTLWVNSSISDNRGQSLAVMLDCLLDTSKESLITDISCNAKLKGEGEEVLTLMTSLQAFLNKEFLNRELSRANITWLMIDDIHGSPVEKELDISVKARLNVTEMSIHLNITPDPRTSIDRLINSSFNYFIHIDRDIVRMALTAEIQENINKVLLMIKENLGKHLVEINRLVEGTGLRVAVPITVNSKSLELCYNMLSKFTDVFDILPSNMNTTLTVNEMGKPTLYFTTFKIVKKGSNNPGETLTAVYNYVDWFINTVRRDIGPSVTEYIESSINNITLVFKPEDNVNVYRNGEKVSQASFKEIPQLNITITTPTPLAKPMDITLIAIPIGVVIAVGIVMALLLLVRRKKST